MTEQRFGHIDPLILWDADFLERPRIRFHFVPQWELWDDPDMADALKWFLPTADQVKQTRYSEAIATQVGTAPKLDMGKDKL